MAVIEKKLIINKDEIVDKCVTRQYPSINIISSTLNKFKLTVYFEDKILK